MKQLFRLATIIVLIATAVSAIAFICLFTATDNSVWSAVVGILLLISGVIACLCLTVAAAIATAAQMKANRWQAVGRLLLEMVGYFLLFFFLDYFLEKDRTLFDSILPAIIIPFAFRAVEYIWKEEKEHT